MADKVTKELIYEVLKSLQEGQAKILISILISLPCAFIALNFKLQGRLDLF